MIEIDVLNGFRELPKDEAKAAIQKYAEENGISVKRQLSVDNMINFVLDAADEAANEEVKEIVHVDTPVPDIVGKTVIGVDISDDSDVITVESIINNAVVGLETKVEHEPVVEPEPVVESVVESVVEDVVTEPTPVIEGIEYEFPSSFRPLQLIGIRDQYLNVPYWVLDWILKTGKEWKKQIHTYPNRDLIYVQSILFYIKNDGSVCVRESRNSGFHHLY